MNLSYNLIEELPSSGFEGLGTLETLDLSFNDLREVDDRAFDGLDWLSTLKVFIRTLNRRRKKVSE